MAMRAVKFFGEQYAPVTSVLATVRQFTSSRMLMADVVGETANKAVRGPGSPGAVSSGVKDMESGDREAVTEGAEGPEDVANTMKKRDNAELGDSTAEGLKGMPVKGADTD